MCVNCNLLNPITDEFADFLCVPRRKYLVVGYTTNVFTEEFESFCGWDGSAADSADEASDRPEAYFLGLNNWTTCKYFSFVGADGVSDHRAVLDSGEGVCTVLKSGHSLTLYEGKLRLRPGASLPEFARAQPDWDAYLDMFIREGLA